MTNVVLIVINRYQINTVFWSRLFGSFFNGIMIRNELNNKELYKQLAPLLLNIGIKIIEISEYEKDGRCTIRLVIQSQNDNTTIKDCTQVHKIAFPRLELLRDSRDVYLEVSTPGIQRAIKDVGEFNAFIGKDVKILHGEDWVDGTLILADEQKITIQKADEEELDILFNTIKKAKLVYNWEGKK